MELGKSLCADSPVAADHNDLVDKDVGLFSKKQNQIKNHPEMLLIFVCF